MQSDQAKFNNNSSKEGQNRVPSDRTIKGFQREKARVLERERECEDG